MEELKHEDLPGYGQMLPILTRVGQAYKMTIAGMLHSKSPTPLEARSVCCWLAQQLGLQLTFSEVAQVLRRSRNSAEHGVARVVRLRASDPRLRALTDKLLSELRAEMAAESQA